MMWFAIAIAVCIGIGLLLEMLARIAVLHIPGSLGDNEGWDV